MTDTAAAAAVPAVAPAAADATRARPVFPKRCIITAGMPYGNKDLHFGHAGGVFIPADAFARFMRDRIGAENVIFVSGTDCYGSPAVEAHRQLVEKGAFSGTIEEFVASNHERQKETLAAYHIAPNLFAASALGRAHELHEAMGAYFLQTLHRNGHMEKRESPQFYDPKAGTFLSGRQVIGRCPVQGCKSEQAYADECSLGHQYEPRELIAPKSSITGERPEMRNVTNWYLGTEQFRDALRAMVDWMETNGAASDFAIAAMREFFEPPTIYVTREQADALAAVAGQLPPHTTTEGKSKSLELRFNRLAALEEAKATLGRNGIRYRTGKTLVPFRLTGNLAWGLKAPDIEGLSGLTFWVWPESLWAPISFSETYIEKHGNPPQRWREWWCQPDARVYQFIGEDNVYFYGLAQGAMWLGLQGPTAVVPPPAGQLQISHLIVSRHLLFLDKKASSSGQVKPPMARDLLEYYTADQLRIHFLNFAMTQRNVSFRPKPLDPAAAADPRASDPVLKDGNILSNALNRAVRSCFYTVQKYYDGRVPVGDVSAEVLKLSENVILKWEDALSRQQFHTGIEAVSEYIREINSRWTKTSPFAETTAADVRRQALIDAFHMVRVSVALLHPVAPAGTERVREYLGLDESFWSWDRIFEPLYAFMADPQRHAVKFLEPKADFFEKHPSQLTDEK